MKIKEFKIETSGRVMTLYSNALPVATATFGDSEITLKTIYHEQTSTWKDTALMFDYIEQEHIKFINSNNE